MKYILFIDTNSKDQRVHELANFARIAGWSVADFKDRCDEGKAIYFLAPRYVPDFEIPDDAIVFGFGKLDLKNYICLSDDEVFVQENNYLTALAQKELLIKRFRTSKVKLLIIGYGKLTAQLEKVLTDADIHILQFNHNKTESVKAKYLEKAYFEKAPLHKFPVIINTIPKQVINLKKPICSTIYELASPPYGFDFSKVDITKIDYNIEAGLPGRFYPREAAKAVFDCIIRKLGTKKTIVLCLTASPCSYGKLIPVLEGLCKKYDILPVMSESALKPNRFLNIEDFKQQLRDLCGNNIITTIAGSETLASNKNIAASAVVPATGNSIAKLANAITDTPVTMAVKALLRNGKPCILGISTNDALSGNAANIGTLINRKNYYFVPFSQDDPQNKPFSMVCDFAKTIETIEHALQGKQLQPIVF